MRSVTMAFALEPPDVDVAVYRLDESGKVVVEVLDPNFEWVANGPMEDGMSGVKPDQGSAFLDALLAANRNLTYYTYRETGD